MNNKKTLHRLMATTIGLGAMASLALVPATSAAAYKRDNSVKPTVEARYVASIEGRARVCPGFLQPTVVFMGAGGATVTPSLSIWVSSTGIPDVNFMAFKLNIMSSGSVGWRWTCNTFFGFQSATGTVTTSPFGTTWIGALP